MAKAILQNIEHYIDQILYTSLTSHVGFCSEQVNNSNPHADWLLVGLRQLLRQVSLST